MKPTRIAIETGLGNSSDGTETAFLTMLPDTEEGMFMGVREVVMVSDSTLRARIRVEDALKLQKTKSERVRDKIIGVYIHRKECTDKYFIPHGALLGPVMVREVLEINKTSASK
jgi:hypothetical protein